MCRIVKVLNLHLANLEDRDIIHPFNWGIASRASTSATRLSVIAFDSSYLERRGHHKKASLALLTCPCAHSGKQ